MSSINSLTARSLLSQPPLAPRTRARWVILPSLPTTLREALEFLGDLLVQADDLVEEAGDFAVDSVDILGQAHGEIASAERTESADELAAIDKVALGLDVHSTLRSVLLPPPRLFPSAAPRPRGPLL